MPTATKILTVPAIALPTPNAEIARLLGELYEEIGLELVYQPVKCLDTGEVIDGRQREAFARDRRWKIEPIGVRVETPEQRRLLRLALNLTTRPMDRQMTRELIRWCLTRWNDRSDRFIASMIGKSGADKTVASVRRETSAEFPQSRVGADGRRRPVKLYSTSEREFTRTAETFAKVGDALEGRVTRREVRRLSNLKERSDFAEGSPATTPAGIEIRQCDFRTLDVKPGSIDLAVCDPPWSRDWESNRQDFANKIKSSLRPGGFCLAYTGHGHLAEFIDLYRESGLVYRWIVSVVWSGAPSIRPDGTISTGFTPVLIFQNGGRWKTPNVVPDCIRDDGGEPNLHDWQQAVGPLATLIGKLTIPGARIADLTLGSGTSAVATLRSGGGRTFIGAEIDAQNCAIASRRVREEFAR